MNNLNWNEYFLALSKVAALRSKDPNTKVGAVLVNENNRVIGMGYNGMPGGNDNFPWGRNGETRETKYPYVIHAEMNAILNSTVPTNNSVIYVSLFPCSDCAKHLIQAGVKHVYYEDDKYKDTDDNKISKYMFKKCKIKVTQLKEVKVKVG